jgi:hypothetical protein
MRVHAPHGNHPAVPIRPRRCCLLDVEQLEGRTVLSLSVGSFARIGVVAGGVAFQVRQADFTLPQRRVVLLRAVEVSAVPGVVLGPVGLSSQPRGAGRVLREAAAANGEPARVLLGKFRLGSFRLTTAVPDGSAQVVLALAGDADGNFRVTSRDLDLIRRAQGKRLGAAGYSDALDVDLDGTVSARDGTLASLNLGAATTVRPLAVSAALSPASDPDGDRVVNHSQIEILGRTRAGAKVSLDRGPDGRVDFTTTASRAGVASFKLDVPEGMTRFRAQATDRFGQSATAELAVTHVPPTLTPPEIAIGDLTQAEGDSGNTTFTFPVRLSSVATSEVAVSWSTADGTATAGSDFVAASGLLKIPAGQTAGIVTVLVGGDTITETDETFVVNLSNPTGATLADGQGLGTIVNDDTPAPVDLSGMWALQGRDVAGTDWLANLVIQQNLTSGGGTLSGYFDWQSTNLAAYGREYFTGTYSASTRLVHLEGNRLENARGIVLGRYDAKVDATGNLLVDGSWSTGIVSDDWTAARARTTESSFSTGLDGWQVVPSTAATLTRVSSGGDPGGYARVEEAGPGGQTRLSAGSKFAGGWQGGTRVPTLLSFDYQVIEASGPWVAGPIIQLTGLGGAARLELPISAIPSVGQWRTFVFALDAATWSVTSGSLAGLLRNVTALSISADSSDGAESLAFDNIRLLVT